MLLLYLINSNYRCEWLHITFTQVIQQYMRVDFNHLFCQYLKSILSFLIRQFGLLVPPTNLIRKFLFFNDATDLFGFSILISYKIPLL